MSFCYLEKCHITWILIQMKFDQTELLKGNKFLRTEKNIIPIGVERIFNKTD